MNTPCRDAVSECEKQKKKANNISNNKGLSLLYFTEYVWKECNNNLTKSINLENSSLREIERIYSKLNLSKYNSKFDSRAGWK